MDADKVINRLRKGDKILCPVCKKKFIDVSLPSRKYSNYFHCEDPKCKGCIHIQKSINVE
jgi:predicted RNA-binding Zn-ribbon protein involved in translation (DUF1610 family)